MPIEFRPIAEPDIDAVERWLDDAESRRRLGGMIPFRPCFEYQQQQPDYYLWIASDGADAVGLAGFEIDASGTAAVLLLVRPDRRRLGYGKRILQALCTLPEARRATTLMAPVEPDHLVALRCAAAAGFVNEGPDPSDPEFLRFVRGTQYCTTAHITA